MCLIRHTFELSALQKSLSSYKFLENRPKTGQILVTIIVFYRNKRFGALEPPSARCSCHVLWARVLKHVYVSIGFWGISVTKARLGWKFWWFWVIPCFFPRNCLRAASKNTETRLWPISSSYHSTLRRSILRSGLLPRTSTAPSSFVRKTTELHFLPFLTLQNFLRRRSD